MPGHRTIWEEGHRPGPQVVRAAGLVVLTAALLHVALDARVGVLLDVVLVATCVAAALQVRPRDFFTAGVLPPLLLGATVLVVALIAPERVARRGDGVVQAVVSGLAHHAVGLVVACVLTLAVLALRRVALKQQGLLRPPHRHHVDRAA